MTRFGLVLFVVLLVAPALSGQTSKPRPRNEAWYEQALRHINPDNTDYGSIWEQRKRAFLSQLGNRYFQYSFGATVAIVLLLTVTIVQRVNYKRALNVAAQSIADVIRHDEYSRQVAREAIRRYNDHIEACNRVIEAKQEGLSKSVSATESELYRIREELADTREENKALRNDQAKKSKIIASVKSGPTTLQEQLVQGEMEFPAQYIDRINALEKQLRAEQRKNQHAKGTSVNDHRA
jgi:polyribonucleotide nucleotidyltransferase